MASKTSGLSLEKLTIPLLPRSTNESCDFAVMFYGQHFVTLALFWLLFAIPACHFTFAFQVIIGGNLVVPAATFWVTSGLLGVWTVAYSLRSVFGVDPEKTRCSVAGVTPLATRRVWFVLLWDIAAFVSFCLVVAAALDNRGGWRGLIDQHVVMRWSVVLGTTLVVAMWSIIRLLGRLRIDRVMCAALFRSVLLRTVSVVPILLCLVVLDDMAILVMCILFFISLLFFINRSVLLEKLLLQGIDPVLVRGRTQRYMLGQFAGPAIIVGFNGWIVALMCILGTDLLIGILGGTGPITGPLIESAMAYDYGMGAALTGVPRDPWFGVLFVAAMLFTYQLMRLAWMFVFLDTRARIDCWDMQLQLLVEAQRLEGELEWRDVSA